MKQYSRWLKEMEKSDCKTLVADSKNLPPLYPSLREKTSESDTDSKELARLTDRKLDGGWPRY